MDGKVYYSEKGVKVQTRVFSSEQEACDYLYACIKRIIKYMLIEMKDENIQWKGKQPQN